MLKFFKHSYIAQLVVIVSLMVTLWIPAFVEHVSEVAVSNATTPLYNVFANILGSSSLAMTVLTFVVFAASILFFNSMLSVNQLVTRNSSIGAFVFVLCMCCVPIKDEYYPFLLASTFIMMAMQTVYLIYQVDDPEAYLMNSGVFVALASMFYYPSIILIVWVLVSIVIMDIRKFKHFLTPILGFMMPYFILFVIFYFNHSLVEKVGVYSLAFSEFGFERLGIKTSELVLLGVVLLLCWLSLMLVMSEKADNSVGKRKKVSVTIWLFFFGFLMLFIQKPVMCNGLIYMVLAVFVSMALCYVKKYRVINILLILLMLAVIAIQYLPLLGIEL